MDISKKVGKQGWEEVRKQASKKIKKQEGKRKQASKDKNIMEDGKSSKHRRAPLSL